MPFDSGLARLTREECMELLAGASLARVGVSVDALPAILPVTIALMENAVVFRTVPGTKLALAASNSILAVEADHLDASNETGWSVLVRGIASEVDDRHEIARARQLLADSWIPTESPEHFVRVSCDLVTGRRLQIAART
jgi:nitroimidazol reductase NimA-like FMN-containing flavoprotein (pyridoxamine 5'-phosphate oxidase superfamily)